MKDDAVIKDNEAVYLINEQTYNRQTLRSSYRVTAFQLEITCTQFSGHRVKIE